MRSLMSVIGILLIILGIFGFSYKYFTYTSTEKIAEIGSVKVTADQEKEVFISPLVSTISLAAGVVLVLVGVTRRD